MAKGPSKKKATEIKGEQVKLSFRGGARKGAGRPSKGVKKPVSITMPAADWEEIDRLIRMGEFDSYADYFRFLHQARVGDPHERWRDQRYEDDMIDPL